jgi:hypothetical protein
MNLARPRVRELPAELLLASLYKHLATGVLVDEAGNAGPIHHARRGADAERRAVPTRTFHPDSLPSACRTLERNPIVPLGR